VGRLSGRLFYGCDLFNILFRQPNPSRPATDLAEIWHADRKLLLFMNAGPQWGLKPKNFERCLQFGAYNSGTEVNFCTLKTVENGTGRKWPSTLTFDL